MNNYNQHVSARKESLNKFRDTIPDTSKEIARDKRGAGRAQKNGSKIVQHDEVGVVRVDAKNRKQAEEAVKKALRSLPASPLVELPDGNEGALVSLGGEGSGVYVFYINGETDKSRMKVVADQLEQIAKRLRGESNPSDDDGSPADV